MIFFSNHAGSFFFGLVLGGFVSSGFVLAMSGTVMGFSHAGQSASAPAKSSGASILWEQWGQLNLGM